MSPSDRKIIFLHIPKTAGQSVHAALVDAYGAEAVCPARVGEQLAGLSIRQLNRYRVFSGHLDWSLLDCVKGPRYVFTILREPQDRILSFYFFLREQAAKLPPEDLNKPQHQGMKAALELTPEQYFLGGGSGLRTFLDDHYDNFYANYFAGRHYQARRILAGLIKRGLMTREQLLQQALDNLAALDGIFHVDDMAAVFAKIGELSGVAIKGKESYRVNVNSAVPTVERVERLRMLGAGPRVWERLRAWCDLDDVLWRRVVAGYEAEPGKSAADSLTNVAEH